MLVVNRSKNQNRCNKKNYDQIERRLKSIRENPPTKKKKWEIEQNE